MLALKKDFVRVRHGTKLSYGGSQMWADNKTIRLCGCGPVAAFDTILYLTGRQTETMTMEEYNRELLDITRRFFLLIPPFGINGILLAAGMNRMLRKYELPYRAFWAVSGGKFWERVESMLREDVPVIFSVGPNFPALWRKHRLTFYEKRAVDHYVVSNSATAHYVTATGCDDTWLRIASWGKEYFVRRDEFDEYTRKYSAALVSNVLMLRRIR